jgi:hypothetical protein
MLQRERELVFDDTNRLCVYSMRKKFNAKSNIAIVLVRLLVMLKRAYNNCCIAQPGASSTAAPRFPDILHSQPD